MILERSDSSAFNEVREPTRSVGADDELVARFQQPEGLGHCPVDALGVLSADRRGPGVRVPVRLVGRKGRARPGVVLGLGASGEKKNEVILWGWWGRGVVGPVWPDRLDRWGGRWLGPVGVVGPVGPSGPVAPGSGRWDGGVVWAGGAGGSSSAGWISRAGGAVWVRPVWR